MSYQVMCSLRIYLRRGDLSEASGFWRRLLRRSVATELVHDALRAGISHASLTHGNLGFARGSKVVASDVSEIPFDMLPVCVELVAPRPLLDQFVRDRAKELREATLVLHEGVHVRPSVEDRSESTDNGRVEYVKIGTSPESAGSPIEPVRSALEGLPARGDG